MCNTLGYYVYRQTGSWNYESTIIIVVIELALDSNCSVSTVLPVIAPVDWNLVQPVHDMHNYLYVDINIY